MKRVVLLGSTGSIGHQCIDVVRRHPDRLQVVGLAARQDARKLMEQRDLLGGPAVALFDEQAARTAGLSGGMSAVCDLVVRPDVDLVVVAVAGVAGLLPTVEAIRAGKDIALASKEVLVAAGEIVMPLVREKRIKLTPIDSEHSAVFQCMAGYRTDQIHKVVLTASGGPFRGKTREELEKVTVAQALNHPTWKMGGKITVDSATLMNKGLEMVEAKWLFGLEIGQVDAVVHPQSVVHSLVEFHDGSVLAQMGWPDMRLPIQYALLHPERVPSSLKQWSPLDTPKLTFEPIDHHAFRCLGLARRSVQVGGTMPCVMNGANEEAVALFLAGKCGFLDIEKLVEAAMERHQSTAPTLDNLVEADRWARETIHKVIELKE